MAVSASNATGMRQYRFSGFSFQRVGLETYLQEHPVPFPVYVLELDRNPSAMADYGLGGTPELIVVKNGRVEQVWSGAWATRNLRSVEAFFKVSLPGL